VNDEGATAGSAKPGETRPTTAADTGQGAGVPAEDGAPPGGPERRSGRIVLRGDAARRIGRPTETEDEKLLERRPPEVGRPDFVDSDPWRALRILSEFVEGFDAFASVGPAVTVFGSARAMRDSTEYRMARMIARKLAQHGFAIITGGGPGSWRRRTAAARRAAGCRSAATSSCRTSRA
jgi:hypothetical protein